MIPIDPIDLTNPAPFDAFSYYTHLIFGSIGLFAALAALATRKGSAHHILAGRIFGGAIVIVAITSLVMLSVRLAPPLLVAALTAVYAVGTAILALRPATSGTRNAEYGLSFLELAVVILFVFMSVPHVVAGNIPLIGPMVILAIPLILLIGDINFYRQPQKRGTLRVRRHLARMIWALVIAVRAPITELYADLSVPLPLILFGPLVIAPLLIWWFLRRFPANTGNGQTGIERSPET